MCFRLFLAMEPPAPPGELRALATAEGLDLRVNEAAEAARFVEVAWGDCACSIYTRKEGRLRAVALVEALARKNLQLQLLLVDDGEEVQWLAGTPEALQLEQFRREGLQALPEGRVVELKGTAPALP